MPERGICRARRWQVWRGVIRCGSMRQMRQGCGCVAFVYAVHLNIRDAVCIEGACAGLLLQSAVSPRA